ncbi:MAG: TIGR04282 family arsenosugar biosynthesis glycosyltransferase [Verrucomicrobiota bacterium]|nr:TIGR04282 family arsenosugar biosynthesis glycosyltransferase [Verrucomicrobiota bacterium]
MNAVHRVLDPTLGAQVPPGLCALAVMTKAPQAGKVKTRLTPPLTPAEAAALNVCFLRDTTSAISITVSDGHARGIGVYTPVGQEAAYAEILPAHFELVAQRGDAFGERLTHATEDLLALGFEAVCLIDSDSPTVPQRAYNEATHLLLQPGDRIVLGPSDDGGYYLIGLKKLHTQLFENIDWSSEHVFQQTMDRARALGLEIALLPTWYDVDDRATLRRLCDELIGGTPTATPSGYAAVATHGFLASLVAREGRERIWPNE